MNVEQLVSDIESGTFDSSLAKIKEAVDARLKASRISRKTSDYHIGDTVVFNDLTATRYMVGRKAIVTGMKQKKIVVRLETPVGRFERINPLTGKAESSDIVVPVAIVDLVK
jgi:hypothetical protein